MHKEDDQNLLNQSIKRENVIDNKYENDDPSLICQNIKRETVTHDNEKDQNPLEFQDPLAFQDPIAISFGILKKEEKNIKREENIEKKNLSQNGAGTSDLQNTSSESEHDSNYTVCNVGNIEPLERRVLRSSGLLQNGVPRNSLNMRKTSKLENQDSSRLSVFQRNRFKERLETTSKELNYLNNNKKYNCEECHKRYNVFRDLRDHITAVHLGVRNYKCKQCNKMYSWSSDFRKHSCSVQKSSNIYKCQDCNKQFSHPDRLKQHHFVHKKTKFMRDGYDKTFLEFSFALESHVKAFNLETSNHECVCRNKIFSQDCKLTKHTSSKINKCQVCDRKFVCDDCGERFFEFSDLKIHITAAHCKKPEIAKEDSNLGEQKSSVMSKHDGRDCEESSYTTDKELNFDKKDETYACGNCNEKFLWLSMLKKHIINSHSGIGNYKCRHCNKSFTNLHELVTHTCPEHQNCEEKYKCQLCNRKFSHLEYLKRHSVVHKERKYVCNHCDKRFVEFFEIHNHINAIHYNEVSSKTHKLDKIYTCDSCDERYSYISDLKNHITVAHNGIGYYKCVKCGKIFVDPFQLRGHTSSEHKYKESYFEAQHKKYACSDCGKNYSYLYRLKEHVKAIHSGMDVYKCEQCNKTYSSLTVLKKHTQSEGHKNFKKYECDICGQKYSHLCNLKHHIVVHSKTKVVCEYCAKEFFSVTTLKLHINLVHNKVRDYECQFCYKKFQMPHHLKNHIVCVHEKVKNFVCEQCGSRFLLAHHLRSHVDHIHKGIERSSRPVNYYAKLKAV